MALWKVTIFTPVIQVVTLLLGKSSEQEQQEYNPTISILCSESAFKMQQCFLPSNCPQQPLEIWAINYQWMSTCAVAFNLIFGLSFLMFLSITLPFFFLFFFKLPLRFFFFVRAMFHTFGLYPQDRNTYLFFHISCAICCLWQFLSFWKILL